MTYIIIIHFFLFRVKLTVVAPAKNAEILKIMSSGTNFWLTNDL